MSEASIVAGTLWGEARSLGYEGMHSIANVIMNRVAKQTWWGLTPVEVCLKPYQFSCWLKTDPNYAKIQAVTTDDPQYAMATKIAIDALSGNLPDITNGATSYYSTTIPSPSWAENKTPCWTVGNTDFFNDIA